MEIGTEMSRKPSITGSTRSSSSCVPTVSGAGPRGFATDIENIRTVCDQLPRMGDGGISARHDARHPKMNPE